jgi:hypothetical protein
VFIERAGRVTCLICPKDNRGDSIEVDYWHIERHQTTISHRNALKRPSRLLFPCGLDLDLHDDDDDNNDDNDNESIYAMREVFDALDYEDAPALDDLLDDDDAVPLTTLWDPTDCDFAITRRVAEGEELEEDDTFLSSEEITSDETPDEETPDEETPGVEFGLQSHGWFSFTYISFSVVEYRHYRSRRSPTNRPLFIQEAGPCLVANISLAIYVGSSP